VDVWRGNKSIPLPEKLRFQFCMEMLNFGAFYTLWDSLKCNWRIVYIGVNIDGA